MHGALGASSGTCRSFHGLPAASQSLRVTFACSNEELVLRDEVCE